MTPARRPSFLKSLTLWFGLIFVAGWVWAMSDSLGHRSEIFNWKSGGGWTLGVANGRVFGISTRSLTPASRTGWGANRFANDRSVWLLGVDGPMPLVKKHQFELPGGVESTTVSASLWVIMGIFAAVWAALFYWRYRRIRKAGITPSA